MLFLSLCYSNTMFVCLSVLNKGTLFQLNRHGSPLLRSLIWVMRRFTNVLGEGTTILQSKIDSGKIITSPATISLYFLKILKLKLEVCYPLHNSLSLSLSSAARGLFVNKAFNKFINFSDRKLGFSNLYTNNPTRNEGTRR